MNIAIAVLVVLLALLVSPYFAGWLADMSVTCIPTLKVAVSLALLAGTSFYIGYVIGRHK